MEEGEASAYSKPYFSLLSICVETGLLGCLFLGGALVAQLWGNLRLTRCRHPWATRCGSLANAGVVLFVLCSPSKTTLSLRRQYSCRSCCTSSRDLGPRRWKANKKRPWEVSHETAPEP